MTTERETESPSRGRGRVIDIHAHACPDSLIMALRDDPWTYGTRVVDFEGLPPTLMMEDRQTRPIFERIVDIESGRQQEMESQLVDYQVISPWPDLFGYHMTPSHSVHWTRLMNTEISKACVSSSICGWLGSAPLQDIAASVDEISYCAGLGAFGVVFGSNVAGQYLDHPKYDPIWQRLVDLDLPVMIHPAEPAIHAAAKRYNLRALVGYISDSSTAIAALILGGVLDRFPALRILVSHGGGSLPYQLGRLDRGWQSLRANGAVCHDSPSSYMARLHFDSILFAVEPLRYLVDLVGPERVLLGSDYPFLIGEQDPYRFVARAFDDPAVVRKVAGENAVNLFAIPDSMTSDDPNKNEQVDGSR